AVGIGARDRLGGDGTAGAAAVLDHHRLSQHCLQALRGDAGEQVGRAARPLRHDDPDDAIGIGLRVRRRRCQPDGSEEDQEKPHHHASSPGVETWSPDNQSVCRLSDLISGAQMARSPLIMFANSCGGPPTTSVLSLAMASLNSAVLTTSFTAALSLSMIGFGV